MDIPMWLFLCGAAVAGLVLGGLSTVFIHRWIVERPILDPIHCFCPTCEHPLSLADSLPLIGFILCRGRCRHCGASIGLRYPLVELVSMVWALALALHYGPTPSFAAYLVLGQMLMTGSFIDFETYLLPNRVTLGGAGLALAASFVLPQPGWVQAVLGALAGGGFFWVLQQGYRLWRKEEGLGTGDVKLMFMIGALTGLQGLPFAVLCGALIGLLGSVVYMIRSGTGLATRIPFGPFLALGGLIYLLVGRDAMAWWVTLQ